MFVFLVKAIIVCFFIVISGVIGGAIINGYVSPQSAVVLPAQTKIVFPSTTLTPIPTFIPTPTLILRTPYIPSLEFNGYPCTEDCSGHEAGYEWAEEQGIDDPDDCGGNSQSFIEGCQSYAVEQQEEGDSDYWNEE